MVSDYRGAVPCRAGSCYPRPKAPQRGGRGPAPPVPEQVLLTLAGHCPKQQPRASMLFRSGTEPDPGIPLTADFKREYAQIARAPLPKGGSAHTEACLPFSTRGHREILGPREIVTGGPSP